MVSVHRILIFMLSLSVEALEMSYAAVAKAMAPRACDLTADDLLSPLHLMCNLKNPSLSCMQV